MDDNKEPRVTNEDLKKSIEDLQSLLETDAAEKTVEKSLVSTNGGLTPEVGAPDLDPSLTPQPAEPVSLIPGEGDVKKSETDDDEYAVAGAELRAEMGVGSDKIAKSDVAADENEADEAFAKSLAEAFTSHDAITELARAQDFAKSLVLGTIEGLAIATDDLKKSFSEIVTDAVAQERAHVDQRLGVLAKGLIALSGAVSEMHSEIVKVSNAPVRRTPKSAVVLEKSFGAEVPNTLEKAQIVNALEALVKAGEVPAFEMAKYESTGQLDTALAVKVQNKLGR